MIYVFINTETDAIHVIYSHHFAYINRSLGKNEQQPENETEIQRYNMLYTNFSKIDLINLFVMKLIVTINIIEITV